MVNKFRKCMQCGGPVSSPNHDLCHDCWEEKGEDDESLSHEDHFNNNLETNEIHTVYIMFYEDKEKIGYTKDLNSRIIEIKRKYPNNRLVYFREFMTETEARGFEVWLKKLTQRELNKFISSFQDKIKKVDHF